MFEPMDPHPAQRLTRAFQLLLVAVFGLIAVGFIVGLRQGTPIPDLPGGLTAKVLEPDSALPSMSYQEFDRRAVGVNRQWRSSLADLPSGPANEKGDQHPSFGPTDRREFLVSRLSRRAFDGAPPVVPHPIDQMSTHSCLACHEEGRYIGKHVWAPPMSHPRYANCTQCHAEMHSTESSPWLTVENSFQGREMSGPGSRAWEGAPPTIPHTTWMRENCLSCHGPQGANPIRTSHPWRVSCTQCHAPSAELDQMFTNNGF
ncbi:MAG TPA: cytochrome c3 family protein [Pirellulaceae bacterium]|nr:cytochrome c3 family protein [Pirellulaceae bacterium]